MPSPPLLVLPSSSFLLLSSKFSCVIPSPRTPLISPLPACLRNTGRAMREQRGGEGRRGEGWPPGGGGRGGVGAVREGRETGRRREKAEKGEEREKKCVSVWAHIHPPLQPPPTPPIVAWEEKTRAFLVITSSAPLSEAQRTKRAAIYWSSRIMATLFTFLHLASAKDPLVCGPKTGTWGVSQRTEDPRPPTPPSPHHMYACVLYLFARKSNSKSPTKQSKSQCRGDTYPVPPRPSSTRPNVNMWAHLYVTCLQSSPQARRHTHYTETPCSDIGKGQRSRPGGEDDDPLSRGERTDQTGPLFHQFAADLLQRIHHWQSSDKKLQLIKKIRSAFFPLKSNPLPVIITTVLFMVEFLKIGLLRQTHPKILFKRRFSCFKSTFCI